MEVTLGEVICISYMFVLARFETTTNDMRVKRPYAEPDNYQGTGVLLIDQIETFEHVDKNNQNTSRICKISNFIQMLS